MGERLIMHFLKAQFLYAWYVVKHKWYVFVECLKHGLIWRGITHDLSKLRPSEWFPYAWSFNGPQPRSERTKERFDLAWLKHQHRNDHHWQTFVLQEDSGAVKVLPMPHKARLEMLCDWRGAGKAILGKDADTKAWYLKNKKKMRLHPDTRAWVEEQLNILG
jgi:hypothetical protein